MERSQPNEHEERNFSEFRRKVRSAEVLSAAMERLVVVASFYGPGQHRGAEWPRAEVGVRGGLLSESGLRSWILGLRLSGRKSLEILTK